MNKRIQELADQAELTIRTGRGNTYMSHPEFNKKFAELIVRECANYLDTFNKENMVEEGMDGAYMKAHFGVEE